MTQQQLEYKGKLLGTFPARHYDDKNTKYTIAYNRERTRAWHFFVSGDLFLKWEAPAGEPEGIVLKGSDQEIALYPQEVKEKTW